MPTVPPQQQKARFRQTEIEDFLKQENLRLGSGLKLINKRGKAIYINNEDYLEKFALYLKSQCQLK